MSRRPRRNLLRARHSYIGERSRIDAHAAKGCRSRYQRRAAGQSLDGLDGKAVAIGRRQKNASRVRVNGADVRRAPLEKALMSLVERRVARPYAFVDITVDLYVDTRRERQDFLQKPPQAEVVWIVIARHDDDCAPPAPSGAGATAGYTSS